MTNKERIDLTKDIMGLEKVAKNDSNVDIRLATSCFIKRLSPMMTENEIILADIDATVEFCDNSVYEYDDGREILLNIILKYGTENLKQAYLRQPPHHISEAQRIKSHCHLPGVLIYI